MEDLAKTIETRLLRSLSDARQQRDYDRALTLAFALEASRRGPGAEADRPFAGKPIEVMQTTRIVQDNRKPY